MVTAPRYDTSRGRLETWSAIARGYGELGGICLGLEGEALWRYDAGDFSYVRLCITEVEHNRAAPY